MAKKRQKESAREGSVGLLLNISTMRWNRVATDALRRYELTPIQYVLLQGVVDLQGQQPVMQADLARYAHADVMLTSKHVRELESKGLLSRPVHPTDTRARSLELTRNGQATLKKVSQLLSKIDQDVFKGPGDLDRLHKALSTIQGRKE